MSFDAGQFSILYNAIYSTLLGLANNLGEGGMKVFYKEGCMEFLKYIPNCKLSKLEMLRDICICFFKS